MSLVLVALGLLLALTWEPGRASPPADGRQGLLRRFTVHRPRWRGGSRRRPDLAVLVAEVAARLRAGSAPEEAWAATVERALGPAPELPAGASAEDGLPPALVRLAAHCARQPATATAARTVVAASRLTQALGTPLAEVLDRCAAAVTEDEHARDARRVALAGPRSTARILAGLPVLGLLLGAGLGADPLGTATDGGWGTASVVLGVALLVAGWRWTRVMVTAAERPTAVHATRADGSWQGRWPPAVNELRDGSRPHGGRGPRGQR